MANSKKKSPKQRNFLAIFLGSKASMKKWETLPTKIRRERETAGVEAWRTWVAKNQKAIVEMGAPLGATKQVNRRGVSATRNEMAAYTVVRATSHLTAANMFKNHPHFTIFPGDSIEIMECLDIP